MTTAALMTIEDFASLETADTDSYELVDGEPVSMASGKPRHNEVRDEIGIDLGNYFKRTGIGKICWETDCRTGENTVRRPACASF